VLARHREPATVGDGIVRVGTDLVNFFLLEDGGRVTVVDAGLPSYRPMLDEGLATLGRTTADVEAVVLTHPHVDHIGFAGELGVPVYVHADDEHLAVNGGGFGKRESPTLPYLRYAHAWKLLTHMKTSGKPRKIEDVRTYTDADTLDVPGRPRAIHTGGHTGGHSVLWFDDRGALAVGDLICTLNPLTGRRGPQLLPRALNLSSAHMLDSLSKIEDLDTKTILFGHGDEWTGGAAEAVRLTRQTGPT
jgi:glyoxylase-like metal-dependent hydrolase (beta-lactamase superfamily II)